MHRRRSSREGAVAETFEDAFFVALRGGHARPLLVRCGEDALCAELGGSEVVALAGAPPDLPGVALMELFCAAAAEVGLTLPDIGARDLWLARHADRIEPRIPDETLHRSPMERFNDGLRVLSANLQAARPLDESMARFLEHLGLFIDHRVDQYEPWLQALEASVSRLGTDTPAELARSASALIRSISYGALEASDLAAVTKLRDRSERL